MGAEEIAAVRREGAETMKTAGEFAEASAWPKAETVGEALWA